MNLLRLFRKRDVGIVGTSGKKPLSRYMLEDNVKEIRRVPSNKGLRLDLSKTQVIKSSMEANVFRVYKYLKNKHGKIDIDYEPLIFFFKSKSFVKAYIPDFRVTDENHSWFLEVKGYWDKASLEKVRLFKKDFPNEKLYIIDPICYQKIENAYKDKISYWE